MRPLLRPNGLALGLLLFGLGLPLAAAGDIPLPDGVDTSGIEHTQEIMMGPTPITLQAFQARQSLDELRVFYERELPRAGWTVGPLPALVAAQGKVEAFVEAKKQHPDLTIDPEAEAAMAMLQANQDQRVEAARRMIYATKGETRLLVNLTPNTRGTVVSLNRWEQESVLDRPVTELTQAPPPGDDLTTNICCSGGSVPSGFRKLPVTVPQYPNGRMLTGSAASALSSQQGRTMAEMYLTADSVDEVVAYYRGQMPYSGWTERTQASAGSLPGLPMADKPGRTEQVIFGSEEAMCSIVATEVSEQYVKTLPSSGERTVIFISYLDTSSMKGLKGYGLPERPARRP